MIGTGYVQSIAKRFANLLDSSAASTGAGLVGFLYATGYAGNTVGAWLKNLATSVGAGFIGYIGGAAGAFARTVQDSLRDELSVVDYIDPVQMAFITAGNIASQTRATVQAGLVAAIAAAVSQKRRLLLCGGILALVGNIQLPDGLVMEGHGSPTSAGYATRLDFSTNTGVLPAMYTSGGSDVVLRNFYLQGRTSGSGNELENQLNSRRMTYDSLAIVTSTTGAGIALATTGYNIQSECRKVVVAGAAYGFQNSASSTSEGFYSCYANACTVAGYLIQGTYHALVGCATDTNGLYGYLFQNATSVSLVGCGAESNGRGALYFTASQHIVATGFRSVSNNTAALGTNYSLASINDASHDLTFIGVVDTTPNAATVNALGNVSGVVGEKISFRGDYPLGMSSTVRARTLAADTLVGLYQFDGTSGATPALLAGRGVTSISRTATGDYTLTCPAGPPGTTLMAVGDALVAAGGTIGVSWEWVSGTNTTVRMRCRNTSTFALIDSPLIAGTIYAV